LLAANQLGGNAQALGPRCRIGMIFQPDCALPPLAVSGEHLALPCGIGSTPSVCRPPGPFGYAGISPHQGLCLTSLPEDFGVPLLLANPGEVPTGISPDAFGLPPPSLRSRRIRRGFCKAGRIGTVVHSLPAWPPARGTGGSQLCLGRRPPLLDHGNTHVVQSANRSA